MKNLSEDAIGCIAVVLVVGLIVALTALVMPWWWDRVVLDLLRK